MSDIRWRLALLAAVVTSAGCGDSPTYACPDPSRPCEEPVTAAPPACAGACVASSPDDWSNPVLLWIGAPGAEPPCPPEAPHRIYDGYAGPADTPAACAGCACAPPTGTCGPPAALSANAALCSGVGPGVPTTPLASPTVGACAAGAPLPPWCGGGVCARSVTLAELSLVESPCLPVMPAPSAPDPPKPLPLPEIVLWQTAARACALGVPGDCAAAGAGAVCAPAEASGFSLCILASGDVPCPVATVDGVPSFSQRHTFFDGAEDSRACSDCGCGAPAGGVCTGTVALYEDATCTVPLDTVAVASTGPVCLDVQPPGTALGSAQVSALVYQPGTCPASGGDPIGALTATGPTTFCCQGLGGGAAEHVQQLSRPALVER